MNQPKKFFISHANDDKEIAELIASLLKKITLEQILPWFSSDSSSSGGIAPGSIWFTEIIGKIEQSKAVVALLTPNSITRPWVYFECGIAQSLKDCEVIPVCVGASRDKIYPPLCLYQCYQLSNYRSLKEFLEKILSKFDVKFDEELSKASIEKTVSELTKFNFEKIKEDPKIRDLLLDIKSHIDKRFIEIWERPNINIVDSKIHSDSDISFHTNSKDEMESNITVSIDIKIPDYTTTEFIEIRYFDTLGDIMHTLYLLLKEYVEPYTYLETWALRDKESSKFLVVREVADMIPARYIFKPTISWEIIMLRKPYIASDSNERLIDEF